jgi:hypothetical protein
MAWRGEVCIEPRLGGRHGGFTELGDAVVPRRAVYSHTSEGGEPDLQMYFEVRDGRPECTGIVFTTKPGGRGLRTADLQVLNLDAITRSVFTQVAAVRHRTNPSDGTPVPDNTVLFHTPRDEAGFRRLERDIYEARAAHRGAVSRAELEEVAQVYREHVASSPTRMVAMLCGYKSERTAARRVQQARAAGLLPKTTPGKRKA